MQFVLASASPRRRDLLSDAGFRFVQVSPAVEETSSPALSGRELTLANATRKALAVARARPTEVILSADTLVELEGAVLAKPRDLRHAHEMLAALSGKTHQVYTSVCLAGASGEFLSFSARSDVRFRHLSTADISRYLEKIDPLDKAGAYAAQDQTGNVIENIEGSLSNVIGLPMEETTAALAAFGIRPDKPRP